MGRCHNNEMEPDNCSTVFFQRIWADEKNELELVPLYSTISNMQNYMSLTMIILIHQYNATFNGRKIIV